MLRSRVWAPLDRENGLMAVAYPEQQPGDDVLLRKCLRGLELEASGLQLVLPS